jgi:hypothetical protein
VVALHYGSAAAAGGGGADALARAAAAAAVTSSVQIPRLMQAVVSPPDYLFPAVWSVYQDRRYGDGDALLLRGMLVLAEGLEARLNKSIGAESDRKAVWGRPAMVSGGGDDEDEEEEDEDEEGPEEEDEDVGGAAAAAGGRLRLSPGVAARPTTTSPSRAALIFAAVCSAVLAVPPRTDRSQSTTSSFSPVSSSIDFLGVPKEEWPCFVSAFASIHHAAAGDKCASLQRNKGEMAQFALVWAQCLFPQLALPGLPSSADIDKSPVPFVALWGTNLSEAQTRAVLVAYVLADKVCVHLDMLESYKMSVAILALESSLAGAVKEVAGTNSFVQLLNDKLLAYKPLLEAGLYSAITAYTAIYTGRWIMSLVMWQG